MTNLKLDKPLAVIDIETTGLNKQEDRIVDICITRILPDGTQETLKSLINPNRFIPLESTNIHGITDEDVKDKPTFKDFAQKIISFIEGCDLCGYGVRFDLAFLEIEFKKIGMPFNIDGRHIVDVQNIYFKLDPRDLTAAYSKYCGKDFINSHRAENDVKATIEVLEAQLEQNEEVPKDVPSLNEFSSLKDPLWIDYNGKLAWHNGKAIINFGQYQGKTLEDISKSDSGYLKWMTSADFSSEVKRIINNALEGKFPKPES